MWQTAIAELVIYVETVPLSSAPDVASLPQDRVSVEVRDLPCFHRATRLVWRTRRWRCRVTSCSVRTRSRGTRVISLNASYSPVVLGQRRAGKWDAWADRLRASHRS